MRRSSGTPTFCITVRKSGDVILSEAKNLPHDNQTLRRNERSSE